MGGIVSSVFGGGDSGPSAGELIQQQQGQQLSQVGPGGQAIIGNIPGVGRGITTTLSPAAQQLADILGPAAGQIAGQLGDPQALQQAFIQERLGVLRPERELQESRLRERLAQSGNPLATSGELSPGAAAAIEQQQRQFGQQDIQLANQAVSQAANIPLQQLAQITALSPIFQPPQAQGQGVDVLGAQQIAAQGAAQAQQQQSDLLGGLVGLGTLAFCWVAEELYGVDSVKTRRIRAYLLPLDNLFTRAYRKYGQAWARCVKRYRACRVVARFIWDCIYDQSLRTSRGS